MNTENISGALLPFLMTAVLLSYSMEGVSPSVAVSYDSSQQGSLCINALQASFVKANNHPSGVRQNEEQSTPSQGATAVSSTCNISLQVIPVEKQHLAAPHESRLLFPPYTSVVSSQSFVFQEPDPPQTS